MFGAAGGPSRVGQSPYIVPCKDMTCLLGLGLDVSNIFFSGCSCFPFCSTRIGFVLFVPRGAEMMCL